MDKRRASNFSAKEEDILITLVRKYKNVLENKRTDSVSNKKKIETWSELTKDFNGMCGGVFRDTRILKNKYDNLKKRTKEKFAREKANIHKTGGGPPENSTISNIEIEIKDLIGVQLIGRESEFDGDCDSMQIDHNYADLSETSFVETEVEILEHEEPTCSNWSTYIPKMLRTPKSSALRRNTSNKEQAHCQKNQLCIKITKWADSKKELAELQKTCFMEEHQLKLKLLQDAHNVDMEIKKRESEQRLSIMAEEHKLKMEILKKNIKM